MIIEELNKKQPAYDPLLNENSLLISILENLNSGVALIDDAGKFILYNRRFLRLFGLAEESTIKNVNDQNWGEWQVFDENLELLHVDDHPVRKAAITGGKVENQLVGVKLPSGDEITWMLIGAEPLFGKEGNIEKTICTYSDVTNLRKAEEALRKNREELQSINEELTRFIYTVSHDLKSPLVTITSYTHYLREDIEANDKAAQDKDFRYILNAAEKMSLLLNELLELSKIGRKNEPKSEITFDSVVKSALDLVAGRISQKNVTVKTTGPQVMLFGNEQRLVQLFQNLIDNAVKFMGDQPQPLVEIGSYYDKGRNQVVLFVRDNGSGIDPKYHHKLFRLFEKLDAGSEGTGIGLALIKRIVEVHNGSIWFTSEGPGRGTAFYFTLDGSYIISE